MSFVELDPDGMTATINKLELKSEEVDRFLAEFKEDAQADVVVKMIRVGAAGMGRMVVAEGMDYIE